MDDIERHHDFWPYYVSAEGISRQVIQTDICRWLGNNATVTQGIQDGRRVYFYSAYRELTDAMIQSLKEDSAKYDIERQSFKQRYRREPPEYSFSNTRREQHGLGQRDYGQQVPGSISTNRRREDREPADRGEYSSRRPRDPRAPEQDVHDRGYYGDPALEPKQGPRTRNREPEFEDIWDKNYRPQDRSQRPEEDAYSTYHGQKLRKDPGVEGRPREFSKPDRYRLLEGEGNTLSTSTDPSRKVDRDRFLQMPTTDGRPSIGLGAGREEVTLPTNLSGKVDLDRYMYMPPPDGRAYWDNLTKEYVYPFTAEGELDPQGLSTPITGRKKHIKKELDSLPDYEMKDAFPVSSGPTPTTNFATEYKPTRERPPPMDASGLPMKGYYGRDESGRSVFFQED